jgi:hypothetical protein
MNHHRDRVSDNDFVDPAGWNRASYTPDFLAELEPHPDAPNDYRAAALYHLKLMFAVDEFVTAAPDARVVVVAVAVGLAIGPRLERRQHRRPTRLHAGDVDPFDCTIQDVGRTRFRWRRSLYSARCRIERRQTDSN